MKKIIQFNLFQQLKSSWLLVLAGSMVAVSCSTQVGGYSETDGVYYDPETDTLPEGVIINDSGNRVGEVYDYYAESSIIENSNINLAEQEAKYSDWSNIETNDSDWGLYAGAETNYYDNSWGWYGYNPYWYGPYWRSGFGVGLSWGWGNPWGWYGFDPFWAYGNPYYWGGRYWGYGNPYWGYGGFYNSYYGYNPYYGGGYYGPAYKRSGVNGRSFNTYQMNQGQLLNSNKTAFRKAAAETRNFRNAGFRNNTNSTPRSVNSVPRTVRNPRTIQQNGYPRDNSYSTPRTSSPRNYSTPRSSDTYNTPRSMNSGTRSGGFNSGSSMGGSRSGTSSSGGGMRSGGRR